MTKDTPILSGLNLSKRYGGVQALNKVDINLLTGKVIALIGENGAGKSTLVKAISGAIQPDSGQLFVDGKETSLSSVQIAQDLGIRVIHQVPALALDLSIIDNVFLGSEVSIKNRMPFLRPIDRKGQMERLIPVMQRFAPDLNPNALVRNLKANEQRLVGIIKALTNSARVLILDEPTAALPANERQRLLETVRELGLHGLAICYVSHYLEEVEQIADEVIVLRDGQRIQHENSKPNAERMTQLMLGQAYQQFVTLRSQRHEKTALTSHTRLARIDVTPPPQGKDITVVEQPVSFEIYRGEIVLLTGLVGSGMVEVIEATFGARPGWQATIENDQGKHRINDPSQAIRLGVGYLSDDRIGKSIIPDLSIRLNVSVASLKRLTRLLGYLDERRERKEIANLNDRLHVRRVTDEQLITELSGGNQQKVMVGRWLFTGSRLLIFTEPTQGIDVLAKTEVIQLLEDFVKAGSAVLILTTNDEEFLPLASRVLVMHKGIIVAELEGDQISHGAVVRAAMLSQSANDPYEVQ